MEPEEVGGASSILSSSMVSEVEEAANVSFSIAQYIEKDRHEKRLSFNFAEQANLDEERGLGGVDIEKAIAERREALDQSISHLTSSKLLSTLNRY